MGPPIRMGFKDNAGGAYVVSPNQEFDATSSKQIFDISQVHYKIDNRPQSSSDGRGQKRPHADAFTPRDVKPKPLTSPAVPSFGAPLATTIATSPPKHEDPKPKKKKPRKHNQLGLTPKGETPEVSDDEDEEAKLAATLRAPVSGSVAGGGGGSYSFECEGKVFLLRSPQDIAAWIGERRKRYPTKQRIAEAKAKKALKEEKGRRNREHRDKPREEARLARENPAKKKQEKKDAKKKATWESAQKAEEDQSSAAGRKKRKKGKQAIEESDVLSQAEQLRKTLEETQRKLAELEERTRNMQNTPAQRQGKIRDIKKGGNTENSQFASSSPVLNNRSAPKTNQKRASSSVSNHRSTLKTNQKRLATPLEEDGDTDSDSISLPATHPSDIELEEALKSLSDSDSESSSISTRVTVSSPIDSRSNSPKSSSSSSRSNSDTDSDSSSTASSSSSGAPSTHSLKPSRTIRVPPPPRPHPSNPKPRDLCRDFLRRGRCKYQHSCRFRHRFLDDEEKENTVDRSTRGSERGRGGNRTRGASRGRIGGRGKDKAARGRSKGKDEKRKGKEGEGVDWEERETLFQRLLKKQEVEEQEMEKRAKEAKEGEMSD